MSSPLQRFCFIGILVLLNWLLSARLLRAPMIAEADAYVRYVQALIPWQSGHLWYVDFESAWLPLHMILLRLWFSLFSPDTFSSRMMSFFFGSISIPIYYLYVSRHYSRLTALVSTVLFTFLPLRIALGTQTLSESVFLPFILLLLLIGEQKSFTPISVMLLCGIAVIATGIRFDAWMLLPYVWFSVNHVVRHPIVRLGIVILTLVFPLWWVIESYHQTHVPGEFLLKKIEVAAHAHNMESLNPALALTTVTTRIMELLPLPFLIFVGYGYYRLLSLPSRFELSTQSRHTRFLYLMIPLYLLSMLWFQMIGKTMEWIPQRYLLIPVLFLLPIGLEGMSFAWKISRTVTILLLGLLVCIGPSYYWSGIWQTTRGAFTTSQDPQAMTDFWSLVRFLTSKPNISVQYVRTGRLEDNFPIAASYFSKHFEMMTTIWEDPETLQQEFPSSLPGPLVLEKPIPGWLSGYPVIFDSDSFSVITNR